LNSNYERIRSSSKHAQAKTIERGPAGATEKGIGEATPE
jgi:hypothetical protein